MSMKIHDVAFLQPELLDSKQLDQTLHADTTVRISGETDAVTAAEILRENNAATIVITDDSENVQGIVFPKWVQNQLIVERGVKTSSFNEAVNYLQTEGDEQAGGVPNPTYGHEWLNYTRPVVYWCSVGQHYIDTEVCPYHS